MLFQAPPHIGTTFTNQQVSEHSVTEERHVDSHPDGKHSSALMLKCKCLLPAMFHGFY